MVGIRSLWCLGSTGYSWKNDVTVLFKDVNIYNKLEITFFATQIMTKSFSYPLKVCGG